eukprot:scaffold41044_cov68-Phaeocystis_antarctica.AAC.9
MRAVDRLCRLRRGGDIRQLSRELFEAGESAGSNSAGQCCPPNVYAATSLPARTHTRPRAKGSPARRPVARGSNSAREKKGAATAKATFAAAIVTACACARWSGSKRSVIRVSMAGARASIGTNSNKATVIIVTGSHGVRKSAERPRARLEVEVQTMRVAEVPIQGDSSFPMSTSLVPPSCIRTPSPPVVASSSSPRLVAMQDAGPSALTAQPMRSRAHRKTVSTPAPRGTMATAATLSRCKSPWCHPSVPMVYEARREPTPPRPNATRAR